jgi:hypothetical protein
MQYESPFLIGYGYVLTSKAPSRSLAIVDTESLQKELFKQVPKQGGSSSWRSRWEGEMSPVAEYALVQSFMAKRYDRIDTHGTERRNQAA